jgi:sirohydrochlorin cobaltochelatase
VSEAARPTAPQVVPDEWLARAEFRIGQINGQRQADGTFALHHHDDIGRGDLQRYDTADAAAEIARFDDAGNFRPLKTAPNLRHGWLLLLREVADVRHAIDLFYPGRLAAFDAWKISRLPTTSFRGTLARQTGMYRVAARISDEQADDLIASFCRSDGGCLRTILWRRDENGTIPSTKLPSAKYDPRVDQTGSADAATPLLCQEICNLLVAEARSVVKSAE